MNWSPPQLRRILRIPLCVKESPKQPLWVNQRLGYAISKDAPLCSWFYFPPLFLFHTATLKEVFTLSTRPRCTNLHLNLTRLTSWCIALTWFISLQCSIKKVVKPSQMIKMANFEEFFFPQKILISNRHRILKNEIKHRLQKVSFRST